MPRPICQDCKQDEVEVFEDSDGWYYDERCPWCNDKLIAKANEAREWHEFHCDKL